MTLNEHNPCSHYIFILTGNTLVLHNLFQYFQFHLQREMLLQQPCSMKAKGIILWEYTINYFFIAQLLSRQKAAISIVPLNTEGLQGRGRTTLKLQGSSTFPTRSPPSPLEKLKVRAKEHSPHGLTWFCSDLWPCTRLGLIAIRSMETCRGGK